MIKQALYFAYGSNLDKQQMRSRCPDATSLGPATAKDHRLIFRGVADMEKAPGRETPGGLWLITAKCLEALDHYEGYPGLYTRRWIKVHLPGGGTRRAIVYQMKSTNYAPPSPGYLATITFGYDDFRLSKALLARAIEETQAESRREKREAGWKQQRII